MSTRDFGELQSTAFVVIPAYMEWQRVRIAPWPALTWMAKTSTRTLLRRFAT